MNGVVDVGGGERGIYGAGVFDYCLQHGITFDYLIGVSAGSANEASFLGQQQGRNYVYYTEFAFRKEYMGIGNFIRTGNYLNLDYVYGTTSNEGGDYPLDYRKIASSGKEFRIVATDADTGKPVYFTQNDLALNDYTVFKCSSNLPVINRPYPFRNARYYDGGLSDPVPVQKAFDDGCDKVVLILTRPRNFRRDSKKDIRMSRFLRKQPQMAEALVRRAEVYNQELELARRFEEEGKLLILAPDSMNNIKTLTKDKQILQQLYDLGMKDAEAIAPFLAE